MIELAKKQEEREPLGIDYTVGDARALGPAGPCDVVSAAYLLNYARNRDELQAMCDGIAAALPPGGRFVTVNCNPMNDFSQAPSYRSYGFETSVDGPWQPGAPITWKFFLEDGPFDIENYHLDRATHEAAFHQAGFREVRWHTPRLNPRGVAEFSAEFWRAFLDHPPVAFIECVR